MQYTQHGSDIIDHGNRQGHVTGSAISLSNLVSKLGSSVAGLSLSPASSLLNLTGEGVLHRKHKHSRAKLNKLINKSLIPSFLLPSTEETYEGDSNASANQTPSFISVEYSHTAIPPASRSRHSFYHSTSSVSSLSSSNLPKIQRTRTRGSSVSTYSSTFDDDSKRLAVPSSRVSETASISGSSLLPSSSNSAYSKSSLFETSCKFSKDRVVGEAESGVAIVNEFADVLRFDPSAALPHEVMLQVIAYLDAKNITVCMRVCKHWQSIMEQNSIWRKLFFDNRHWRVTDELPSDICWKELYKTRFLLERRWQNADVTPNALDGHVDSVYCVQFDSEKIITGSRDRTIKLWDSKTGDLIRTIGRSSNEDRNASNISHSGSVLCLEYDDEILITGSSDSSCIIWDMDKYRPIQQVYRHSGGILDISMDKKHIVSCSKDNTVCVWYRSEYSKYGLKRRLIGHNGPVNSVQLNGNHVLSAGGDACVILWSISNGARIREFKGNDRGLACVQLSPCGTKVFSGGNDACIRVWDIDTGACLNVLEGHTDLVRSMHIFSNKMITGSYDQTIRVWDVDSGETIREFKGWHGSWIFSAKADSRRIISTSLGIKPVILDFGHDLNQEYLDFIKA